ncbi:MAG TPA: RHS repeat-associated core domain-containing protein [Gemmatimonadaceae bacterium]
MGRTSGELVTDKRDGSGLAYRRNRYYEPLTGRFTQEDPIGLAGGLNLYGYASGDPVSYSDPFGLCPMCVVIAGAALEGAIEGAVLGAGEQMAMNALQGRPATEGLLAATATGAGVGAVTAGVGSAVRMIRAVSTAGKALGYAEATVATEAEANAAGRSFVGEGRPMSPNRRTGQIVGDINDATGNSARRVHTDRPPGMTTPHANLENAAGGNTHVKVNPTGTKSWWPW